MSAYLIADQSGTRQHYRTYVVLLQADDGRRVYYYTFAASAERAKELACAAELAPPHAVLSVRVSELRRSPSD